MDEKGNILIKRVSRSNVFVKNVRIQGINGQINCVGKEIVEAKGRLDYNKAMKLFDIATFKNNIAQELKETYPERRKLEAQCISCITFGKDVNELLKNGSWIMIINIVALELLKSRLSPQLRINLDLQPKNLIEKVSYEKVKPRNGSEKMNSKEVSKSMTSGTKKVIKVDKGKDEFEEMFNIKLPLPDYDQEDLKVILPIKRFGKTHFFVNKKNVFF